LAYILEEIAPEDREKIINDAPDDLPTQNDLVHAAWEPGR
jgi:hypothetical protein